LSITTQFPAYRLRNGRTIQLEAIYRAQTYDRLLSGSPDRWFNFTVIRRLSRIAVTLLNSGATTHRPILLPTRIWDLASSRWEEIEWYRFRSLPRSPRRSRARLVPEWMPLIASVAKFSSDPISCAGGDYSVLPVIWFQESMATFFDEEPLEELLKIPWDSAAKDLSF
jgi:hypothetical protein